MRNVLCYIVLSVLSSGYSTLLNACENHGGSNGFFSVYDNWSVHNRHAPAEAAVSSLNKSEDQTELANNIDNSDNSDRKKATIKRQSFINFDEE